MTRFIKIKVSPKAKQNKVEKISEDFYKIHTTAAPDKGKANETVIKMLAMELGVSKGRLELIKGIKSKEKIISLN